MKKCLTPRLKGTNKKWFFLGILLIGIFSVFFVFYYDQKVSDFSLKYLYSDVSEIPYRKCGLLLGTTKFMPDGRQNLFFNYRIDAAVTLFNSQKISCIVISGDNSIVKYNEPESMRQDLILRGIPDDKLYLDYAGFDTLDSIVRMSEIFGQNSFTIISQKFHNERAVYIAKNKGFDVVAFNAKDVVLSRSLRVKLREKLARIKMFFELISGARPKFLGETIQVK